MGLTLDLLLSSEQRRADVVRMGWQNVREGVLTIRQSKTGTTVQIPLNPLLVESLEAMPAKNMTFLLTEYQKPFAVAGFGNKFGLRLSKPSYRKVFRPMVCARLLAAGWPKSDASGRR